MRYVTYEHHFEIFPESEKDIEDLKKEYPNLWPFRSVCVAIKEDRQPSFKPVLTGALT